jgi:hypothetical protein
MNDRPLGANRALDPAGGPAEERFVNVTDIIVDLGSDVAVARVGLVTVRPGSSAVGRPQEPSDAE